MIHLYSAHSRAEAAVSAFRNLLFHFKVLAFTVVVAVSPLCISAQWLEWQNASSERLVLTSVAVSDDEEKDIWVADLDNDGHDDVIVVRKEPFSSPTEPAKSDLLLMNVNGILTDKTSIYALEFINNPTFARDVYISDFDHDGWKDVIIANTFGQQPKYYSNLGEDTNGNWLGLADQSTARFPTLTEDTPLICAVWGGDINGDTHQDIYFANYKQSGTALDFLLINDGTGHFTNEGAARLGNLRNSAFGTAVQIHDMDNDGDNDIIKVSTLFSVAPWGQRGTLVLFNNGNGTFTNWQNLTPGSSPYMFEVADFNLDGKKDLYVVDDGSDRLITVTGFVPNTSLTFTNTILNFGSVNGFGGNVHAMDIDLDGDMDVAVSDVDVDIPPCDSGRRLAILRNNNGTFDNPYGTTIYPWADNSYDMAWIDINEDGLPDFISGSCSGYGVFMSDNCGLAPNPSDYDEDGLADTCDPCPTNPDPNCAPPTDYPTTDINLSAARQWNELLLASIRKDFARPPVHARNLFHFAIAAYDSWAAYEPSHCTFLLGQTVDGFSCAFNGMLSQPNIEQSRATTIHYACYRLLRNRFANSPQAALLYQGYDNHMSLLGLDINFTSTDYSTGDPRALGNYLAECIISFGLQDGSNQSGNYANTVYQPINPPMIVDDPGNPNVVDINRWQATTLDIFIDQSGNEIPGATPAFIGAQWGSVTPFSLLPEDKTEHPRNGWVYEVYHDPGTPPMHQMDGGGQTSLFQWNYETVLTWSAHLDATDGVLWDISPASRGNQNTLPTNLQDHVSFYDQLDGGTVGSTGHPVNPVTGQPYQPNIVPRGDYARVLAEFWADGPNSETPPGHWFSIFNYVTDHPQNVKKFKGQGPILNDLEWDVKGYLALGGAMHDVAITTWGIKGHYDYTRPVHAIRAMADLGQATDPLLPNYHPGGLHLIPGYIELVQTGDPLAGDGDINVNKIKVKSWRGHEAINNVDTDEAGVGWILAENWFPFQRSSFVTPPFAGYVSGHSSYSRAAAEVMTMFTGNEFFPGGMGEFFAPQDQYLVFEDGPSVDIHLQWATYRDAADESALSRIWGGIHPPADDIPARLVGIQVGQDAFNKAEALFSDDDLDGVCNFVDTPCSENVEVCDGVDNNCNDLIDEGFDGDGDGVTICEGDCNDNNPAYTFDCLVGEALAFDGLGDYISVPGSASLNGGGTELTIEAWIYTNNTTFSQAIFNKWSPVQYLLEINSGMLQFALLTSDGGKTVDSTIPVPANQWVHVAGVYDGSQIYIVQDGVLVGSEPHSGTITVSESPLYIGRKTDIPAGSFNGKMDEIRVWNRALTPCEIANNMNAELTSNLGGLALRYGLNQGVGFGVNTTENTAFDTWVAGNNGSLNGFALNGSVSNWISPGIVPVGSVAPIYTTPTWYLDADGDQYGAGLITQCLSPGAGWTTAAPANGINDCNDNDASAWQQVPAYFDGDGDGYNSAVENVCIGLTYPPNYSPTTLGFDCDDNNVAVYQFETWYLDADNDGHYASIMPSCGSPGPGYNLTGGLFGDCDDNNALLWESLAGYADADGDGYSAGTVQFLCTNGTLPAGYLPAPNGDDCNDNNNLVWVAINAYTDNDGDGYTVGPLQSVCTNGTLPAGYAATSLGEDCFDNDPAFNQIATPSISINASPGDEICPGEAVTFTASVSGATGETVVLWSLNGDLAFIGEPYVNNTLLDGDVIIAILYSENACMPEATFSTELNISVGGGNTWYLDADLDGYSSATQISCDSPGSQWSLVAPANGSGDCNDNNALINPGATEVCNNAVDENCDGNIDEGCCTMTLSASASNVTCTGGSNGAIDLTVLNAASPVVISWSNGATAEDISSLIAGTYIVQVTDANACEEELSVNVGNDGGIAPAAVAAIDGPKGVCSGQNGVVFSVSAVPGATSYLWTLPNGATGSSTSNSISVNFSSTYNTGNICVRAVNACGQSAQFCRSVIKYFTVPTTPSAITGQSQQVCGGVTLTYSVNQQNNAESFLWTAPSGATILSGQGTNSVTIAFSTAFTGGTLSVRAVNCMGNSGLRTLSIVGPPGTPTTLNGPSNNVCPGSTQTYSTSVVTGASSYLWTVPSGAIINSGQGTTSISVTFPANFVSGQVTVQSVSSCGMSNVRARFVSWAPQISGTLNGPLNDLCGGGTFNYSITAVAGAVSYNWTVPAGCSIVTNNGNSISVSVPANFVSGQICVTAVNSCGATASFCRGMYAVPATPGSITGPASVCSAQTNITYSTAQVGSSTYTWTVPSGVSINSGQGTNALNVNWGSASGALSVRANNACGSSANRTLTVNVVSCMQTAEEEGSELNLTGDAVIDNNALLVYPNPNNGQFVVETTMKGSFTIYNDIGAAVRSFQINELTGTRMVVDELAAGVYLIVGLNENEKLVQRIVVTAE
jgi:hypothetical protein